MLRQPPKISAPPVPPRPSKTVIKEALAKSRKISPVRVLYATGVERAPPQLNIAYAADRISVGVEKVQCDKVRYVSGVEKVPAKGNIAYATERNGVGVEKVPCDKVLGVSGVEKVPVKENVGCSTERNSFGVEKVLCDKVLCVSGVEKVLTSEKIVCDTDRNNVGVEKVLSSKVMGVRGVGKVSGYEKVVFGTAQNNVGVENNKVLSNKVPYLTENNKVLSNKTTVNDKVPPNKILYPFGPGKVPFTSENNKLASNQVPWASTNDKVLSNNASGNNNVLSNKVGPENSPDIVLSNKILYGSPPEKVGKPIVPTRMAPPPPKIDDRTVVYQSNNLTKKNSFKNDLKKVENCKNEKNRDEKYCCTAEIQLSNSVVNKNINKENIDCKQNKNNNVFSSEKIVVKIPLEKDLDPKKTVLILQKNEDKIENNHKTKPQIKERTILQINEDTKDRKTELEKVSNDKKVEKIILEDSIPHEKVSKGLQKSPSVKNTILEDHGKGANDINVETLNLEDSFPYGKISNGLHKFPSMKNTILKDHGEVSNGINVETLQLEDSFPYGKISNRVRKCPSGKRASLEDNGKGYNQLKIEKSNSEDLFLFGKVSNGLQRTPSVKNTKSESVNGIERSLSIKKSHFDNSGQFSNKRTVTSSDLNRAFSIDKSSIYLERHMETTVSSQKRISCESVEEKLDSSTEKSKEIHSYENILMGNKMSRPSINERINRASSFKEKLEGFKLISNGAKSMENISFGEQIDSVIKEKYDGTKSLSINETNNIWTKSFSNVITESCNNIKIGPDENLSNIKIVSNKEKSLAPLIKSNSNVRIVPNILEDIQNKQIPNLDSEIRSNSLKNDTKDTQFLSNKEPLDVMEDSNESIILNGNEESTTTSIMDSTLSEEEKSDLTKRAAFDKKVQFDDKLNHEILIQELENMRLEQERLSKRQRKPFREIYEDADPNITHPHWLEFANGEQLHLSSCQIFLEDTMDPAISSSRIGQIRAMMAAPSIQQLINGKQIAVK